VGLISERMKELAGIMEVNVPKSMEPQVYKTRNPRYFVGKIKSGEAYPKNGYKHGTTKHWRWAVFDVKTGKIVHGWLPNKKEAMEFVDEYAKEQGILK
jgi:hypothetical protein